jgi:hypothetical protein
MRFWIKLLVMTGLFIGAASIGGYWIAMHRIVRMHRAIDERYRRGEQVPAEQVRALDEALYKIDPPASQPVWAPLTPMPATRPIEFE